MRSRTKNRVPVLAAAALGVALGPFVVQAEWTGLSGEPLGGDGHEWNGYKELPVTTGEDLTYSDLTWGLVYIPDPTDAGPQPSPLSAPAPWSPDPEPAFLDDHEWNGFKDQPLPIGDELTWDDVFGDLPDGDIPIGSPELWYVDPQPGPCGEGWTPGGGLFVAPQYAVPEPASVVTLLLGAGLLVARRRRQ